MQQEDISAKISPETTGKGSQFGALDELIKLAEKSGTGAAGVSALILLIYHARSNGDYNTEKEFRSVFEKIENEIGSHALEDMHFHVSGIEYTEKGEKNHLILEESILTGKLFSK